jgi:YVTN family beta-propeller protein
MRIVIGARPNLLPGMPPLLKNDDVYAAAGPNMLAEAVKGDRELVYVPNTQSNDVYVIDPKTFKVIDRFPGGNEPQHVIPGYDLRTLYVAADKPHASSLTPIDPTTGKPGAKIAVEDPYNMYFTPDGKYAIVVAEFFKRLDFYDPHTWQQVNSLALDECAGVDHMDFTADGTLALASCEFAGRMVVIDVANQKHLRTIQLTQVANGMPQDVRLSPDGKLFYVADMHANGVYVIDGEAREVVNFIPTGNGTHGLYFDRQSKRLFITNRGEGSISVLDLATQQLTAKWQLPGGGSPDMGGLTADGTQFWVSGRYHGVVYAVSTEDGHLLAKIPVGSGPHGLCVWPQPGRYSLGHTGTLR